MSRNIFCIISRDRHPLYFVYVPQCIRCHVTQHAPKRRRQGWKIRGRKSSCTKVSFSIGINTYFRQPWCMHHSVRGHCQKIFVAEICPMACAFINDEVSFKHRTGIILQLVCIIQLHENNIHIILIDKLPFFFITGFVRCQQFYC